MSTFEFEQKKSFYNDTIQSVSITREDALRPDFLKQNMESAI
jgi:hypothetical protein